MDGRCGNTTSYLAITAAGKRDVGDVDIDFLNLWNNAPRLIWFGVLQRLPALSLCLGETIRIVA